jgi:predicted aspartyl protease
METATMGRVVVAAKIDNIYDLHAASQGQLLVEQIRTVEVADAQIDTGATTLSLPKQLIDRLGLPRFSSRQVQIAAGPMTLNLYGPARLTVQERFCNIDVAELPDGCPVLIGQVPLEIMDFVVDPKGQRLIGNPAHGGAWVMDMF